MFRDKLKFLIPIGFFFMAVIVYSPLLINMNHLMRGDWDLAFFNNAVSYITINEYHQVPLWNPFYCGGFSYIGSPDSTLFSIQTLFSLVVHDIIIATKLNVIFHLFVGLLGMYLLCQYLGMAFQASLTSAVIFVFNGCMSSHIGEGPLDWFSIYFLPFVFLFFIKSQKSLHYATLTGMMLAVMFCDRGGYTFNFTVLLLGIFVVIISCLESKFKLFLSLILSLAFCVGFSAPKLFPLIATLQDFPRSTDVGSSPGLMYLLNMYVFKNLNPYGVTLGNMGWWELNSYVGVVPALLFTFSAVFKRALPFFLSAIVLLIISLGNFCLIAPWTILHSFPVFNTMWVSSRVNFVFIFMAAISFGYVLDGLGRCSSKDKKWFNRRALVTLLTCFIIVDLLSYSHFIIGKTPRSFSFKHDQYQKSKPFEQIEMSAEEQFGYGGWSNMYSLIWQNKGIMNGYFKVPFPRSAKPNTDPDYQGEYYLEDQNGEVNLVSWSPNRLVYQYQVPQPNRLIINQNFDKEWRGENKVKVENRKGLLSIPLNSGSGSISLYYLPHLFMIGVGIFFFTVIVAVLSYLLPRKRSVERHG